MTDIEGREINVGDEVYCAFHNAQLTRIRIVKETDRTIHYQWQLKEDSKWANHKKGDWSIKTYLNKSSHSFKNMLKC